MDASVLNENLMAYSPSFVNSECKKEHYGLISILRSIDNNTKKIEEIESQIHTLNEEASNINDEIYGISNVLDNYNLESETGKRDSYYNNSENLKTGNTLKVTLSSFENESIAISVYGYYSQTEYDVFNPPLREVGGFAEKTLEKDYLFVKLYNNTDDGKYVCNINIIDNNIETKEGALEQINNNTKKIEEIEVQVEDAGNPIFSDIKYEVVDGLLKYDNTIGSNSANACHAIIPMSKNHIIYKEAVNYSVWGDSHISAVYILDENKKIISESNDTNGVIKSDTTGKYVVINFSFTNFYGTSDVTSKDNLPIQGITDFGLSLYNKIMNKPIFTLVSDDYNPSSDTDTYVDNLIALCSECKIPFDFAAKGSANGSLNQYAIEKAKQIIGQVGFLVHPYHSYYYNDTSESNWVIATKDVQKDNIISSFFELKKNNLQTLSLFVYPGGTVQIQQVRDAVRETCILGEGTYQPCNTICGDIYKLGRISLEQDSFASIKAQIDKYAEKNCWIIIYIHGMAWNYNDETIDDSTLSRGNLKSIIDYCKDKGVFYNTKEAYFLRKFGYDLFSL